MTYVYIYNYINKYEHTHDVIRHVHLAYLLPRAKTKRHVAMAFSSNGSGRRRRRAMAQRLLERSTEVICWATSPARRAKALSQLGRQRRRASAHKLLATLRGQEAWSSRLDT